MNNMATIIDEEVAAEASNVIRDTAHLGQFEQSEKMRALGYTFLWLMSADKWLLSDLVNRLIHNDSAAKKLLLGKLFRPGNAESEADCARLREGRFVHFQLTPAFDGGSDAYIVYRKPDSNDPKDVVIIRMS